MNKRNLLGRPYLLRIAKVVLTVVALVSFGLINSADAGQDVFTTPGAATWTAPSGSAAVNEVLVQVWSGGGGGGGDGATNGSNDNFGAAGGGGGAFATGTVNGISDGSSHNYTVGAGGAAGSDNAGSAGGASLFINATTVGAAGGGGGGGNNGALGAGGTVTGGTGFAGGNGSIPTQGGSAGKKKGGAGGGSAGPANTGSFVVDSETAAAAVAGGGKGGDGGTAATTLNGGVGGQPGGGGGGGGNGTTTGGSGANGKVVINWKPQVTINQAVGQPEITNTTIDFDVVFSEAVTGFDATDLTVANGSVTNVAGSGANYVVTVTAAGAGVVSATVKAGGVQDGTPGLNTNDVSKSTDNSVTYTTAATPTVGITNSYGASTNDNTVDFTVTFNVDVTGFSDLTDVDISGSSAPCSVASITGGPQNYIVTVNVAGDGDVVAFVPANVATGSGLNNEASPLSSTVNYDGTQPVPTLDCNGPDPDDTLPISCAVAFDETVTGFVLTDVTLSGTAANLAVTATSGSGSAYTIVVDDPVGDPVATSGTVIVTINTGAATDAAGNTSTAATVIKNSITYDGGVCVESNVSTITIDPPPVGATDDPIKGAAVDLTSLFTANDVPLFTYTIDDGGTPYTIDTPWSTVAYGLTGPEVVNLKVSGADSECGTLVEANRDITIDNSSTNFLMHNSDVIGSDKWGVDGWGIAGGMYGEFTCATCHTRTTTNIKRIKTAITAPNTGTEDFPGGAASPVLLTTVVDTSAELGDDDPGATGRLTANESNRICEVCHSRNKYHNYDSDQNAINLGHINHENQSDCVSCHPHSTGFKDPGCTGCHGEPPTSSATMVFYPGGPDATGALADSSIAPGAHEKHALTMGIECIACHKGNTMPAPSTTIEMGFEVTSTTMPGFTGTVTGGDLAAPLDGRMTPPYTFAVSTSAAADTPATSVSKVDNDDLVCSNLYCHGNWSGNNGSNNSPSWVGGSAEAACGTCHGASGANPPQTAAHDAHANSSRLVKLACNACHPSYSDAGHMNGDVAWQLAIGDPRIGTNAKYRTLDSGTTGGNAPSGTFGTCETVYCHGSNTPNWGTDVGNIDCESCHPASSPTLESGHLVHYDSASVVNGNTTDNTSTTGNYIFQCGNCHNPATTTHAGGVAGTNQHAQVKLSGGGSYTSGGGLAGTVNGVFEYTEGTCNFNACHQNGRGGVPNDVATWGSTLPATCTGCHNSDVASTEPMISNAHNVHVSDASVMEVKPCQMCHVSSVDADNRTILDKTLHVNGRYNVTILDTWDSDLNPENNYSAGGCDSVYCHSNGQESPAYNPVSWTGTIGCNGCHDDAGVTTALTHSHEVHIGTDPSDGAGAKQFGYGCVSCHVQTAASNSAIGTVANHINKFRDVSVSATYGGDGSNNTDYTGYGAVPPAAYDDLDPRWPQAGDTCANILCHGTGSPQWTVGTATGDCSTCHGMSKIGQAAGSITVMDTEGHTADSDRQVGAHSAHLNALNNYSAPMTCDNCHSTTVSAMASKGTYVEKVKVASHNDTAGPAEITFANLATKFATQPAVYTAGTGSCNSYCHGGVNVGMLAGANNDPQWDQNAYLTGVATAAGDCSKCHYSPPPGKGHLGNEEIVWTGGAAKSCGTSNCHDEVIGTDGVFKVNATLHVNGVTNTTATCTTCHITMPPNTGSHQKHYVHLEQDLGLYVGDDIQPAGDGTIWKESNYPLCASCHDMNSYANHFGDTSDIMGSLKTTETFSNTPLPYPEYDAVDKNCYNVRCHFQATPDWYSPNTWPGWP